MALPQHTPAPQMALELAIKKHLDAAVEATGLLAQALLREGAAAPDYHDVERAYRLLSEIRRRRGIR